MAVRVSMMADGRFSAVIFDLDGVVTRTADLHARAWKKSFDDFLEAREEREGESQRRFDASEDYLEYVDGKPRYEGIASFLDSRGIDLPRGSPDDSPGTDSIYGLGKTKNRLFLELLDSEGVQLYESTIGLLRELLGRGVRTAVVSSSKNCRAVLRAAGIESLFLARVDGAVAERLGLAGKPEPDIFLKSAEFLGAEPREAVVIEDSQSGVRAGRAGKFGLVIGVDRGQQAGALLKAGAHKVVSDLGETSMEEMDEWFRQSSG